MTIFMYCGCAYVGNRPSPVLRVQGMCKGCRMMLNARHKKQPKRMTLKRFELQQLEAMNGKELRRTTDSTGMRR